jgi:hypothetical protein
MSENLDVISDPKVFNQEFLNRVDEAGNGNLTKVAASASKMLRTQLREEGFMRKIIPPQMISNEDLDRVVEHDRPVRIEDMEPNSKGASTLPFNVSADAQFFFGRKFLIEFFVIKTPKFMKSIHELRTYNMDLREVITENALKDIQTEEDGNFINLIDELVGPANAPSSVTGVTQNHEVSGGITRTTYPEIKKFLEKQRLNNGVFLMNRATAKEFEKWFRDEVGGDLAEDIYREGLKALGTATIMGVPHIFTIKDELVPDNVVYLFTEPNFLGRFYILQDVTMYVEKKEDQLCFGATECIGFSIANVLGVHKVTFV